MTTDALRRRLFAVVVLLHFTALALSALPWSRFVAVLSPYYAWYTRLTGQVQSWAMYQYPGHRSDDFELIARFPDGREERPWGDAHAMSSRNFYFLESLFTRNDGNQLANEFLDVVRARWESTPRPNALVLRRTSRAIQDYARVPEKAALGPPWRQEIVRRW